MGSAIVLVNLVLVCVADGGALGNEITDMPTQSQSGVRSLWW